MANLVRVDIALSALVEVLTKPRNLVAIPVPIAIDSGVNARFFAANLVDKLVNDIVSDSKRIFVLAVVTVEIIVIVSVRVLTIF